MQLAGRNLLQRLLIEWETERRSKFVFGRQTRFKVNPAE